MLTNVQQSERTQTIQQVFTDCFLYARHGAKQHNRTSYLGFNEFFHKYQIIKQRVWRPIMGMFQLVSTQNKVLNCERRLEQSWKLVDMYDKDRGNKDKIKSTQRSKPRQWQKLRKSW